MKVALALMFELVRLWRRGCSSAPSVPAKLLSSVLLRSSHSASPVSPTTGEDERTRPKREWLTLPPFVPPVDAAAVGKELSGLRPPAVTESMTALKWVRRCCPDLPMSLVQKLFRLKQVGLIKCLTEFVLLYFPADCLCCRSGKVSLLKLNLLVMLIILNRADLKGLVLLTCQFVFC